MIVTMYDAIHANISHLPPGHAAGYTTGSLAIQWTGPDWKAHPGAVRIDQDPAASDRTADVLDVERGAATPSDCAPWARTAGDNYASGTRPGQRQPAIYTSASNVTVVVNALNTGGVHSGVNLWVANWNLTDPEAATIVQHRAGPFPIVAVQWKSLEFYDLSVVASPWLNAVSVAQAPPGAFPSGRHIVSSTPGTLRQLAQRQSCKVTDIWMATAAGLVADGLPFGDLEAKYLGHGDWDARMPEGMILWLP